MKRKNVYFRIIEDQIALLAVLADRIGDLSEEEIRRMGAECARLHYALCRRLIREFIAPLEREDLYRVSAAVRDVFYAARAGGLSAEDAAAFRACVRLIAEEPFRLDVSAVRRAEEVTALWEKGSARAKEVLFRCRRVAELLSETAVKNA